MLHQNNHHERSKHRPKTMLDISETSFVNAININLFTLAPRTLFRQVQRASSFLSKNHKKPHMHSSNHPTVLMCSKFLLQWPINFHLMNIYIQSLKINIASNKNMAWPIITIFNSGVSISV